MATTTISCALNYAFKVSSLLSGYPYSLCPVTRSVLVKHPIKQSKFGYFYMKLTFFIVTCQLILYFKELAFPILFGTTPPPPFFLFLYTFVLLAGIVFITPCWIITFRTNSLATAVNNLQPIESRISGESNRKS